MERLEARDLLAASNLFFPPADAYPTEPLREPPVIDSRGGRLEATLNMVRAGFDSDPILYGGQPVLSSPPDPNSGNNPNEPVYAMAYQVDAYGQSFPAQYPGPILRLDPGETIAFDVQDNLADAGSPPDIVFNTNLHTHGLHVSSLNNGDNVFRQITPGEGMDVEIPVPADHPHGLNWYHVHRHGSTHDQVYGGLAGFIVVGDPLDPWPEARATVSQRYMALSEVNIQDGRLANFTANTTGKDFADGWQKRINGQVNPTITLRPGETQVWNLGSIGAFGGYNLAITDDNLQNPWQATVLVQDGNGQFVQPYPLTLGAETARMDDLAAATLIMPGNRLSLAVTAPESPGTYYLIDGWGGQDKPAKDGAGNQQYYALATIKVEGTPSDVTPVFGDVGGVNPLFSQQADVRRTFEFAIVPGATPPQNVFTINGAVFGEGVMPQLQIGTVEEWTLTNPTNPNANANHPFHIHQGDFIVTAVDGVPVDPTADPPSSQSSLAYVSGRDVIDVPSGGSVTIRFLIEDFPGKYVFHCHILKHEDLGMMSPVIAFGPADGIRMPFGTTGGSAGAVVLDGQGVDLGRIHPFPPSYRGEVVTAAALGESQFFETMVAATGQGHAVVRVYEDGELTPRTTFRAFRGPRAARGVSVAVGDLDGDGNAEVVVGSRSPGASAVRIFDLDGNLVRELIGTLPGRFPRGVNVAVGDVDGDNFDDVIVSAGAGREPIVAAVNGQDLARGEAVPSTLFTFVAGGGRRAGARVAVGYVAPGTTPSYNANVITTPESGAEAGTVEVWNPDDLGVPAGAHDLHGDNASDPDPDAGHGDMMPMDPPAPMVRYRPFAGRRAALRLSSSYLGLPGTPVVAAWRNPFRVAFSQIDAADQVTTEIRVLGPGRG